MPAPSSSLPPSGPPLPSGPPFSDPSRSNEASREIEQHAEIEQLAEKLSIVSALRIGLVTVSLGASFLLSTSQHTTWQSTLIIAAYLISIVYALGLRSRIAVRAFAVAQVVVDSVLASALVFMTGGVDSLFIFSYVFVVIGAAMTLFRQGAIVAVLACLSLFGVVSLLQSTPGISFLAEVTIERAVLSLLSNSIALGLVGVLSSTLAENLRDAGKRLAEKESDLERLEELHAAILRSLPAGLVTVDRGGTIRFANESARSILRRQTDHLRGISLGDVLPEVAEVWSTIKGPPNARERHECEVTRADGSKIRLGYAFAPLGASEDRSFILTFQDVTDIVRLKQAVERAERLAMVGNLASGLAHEIRNPLSSMCASIHVLRATLQPPEHLARLMDNVFKEADRLNGLITDFLVFARPRQLAMRSGDVSQHVANVVDVFRRDPLVESKNIQLELQPNLQIVFDGDAVRQVLWNLLRNAAQAIGESGVIRVTTRQAGDMAEISISDNGPGIPEENLLTIFEPFYTTKEGGTGLGLPIAQSLIGAHHGRILVNSSSAGTEFIVQLPIEPQPVVSLAEIGRIPSLPPV